MSCESIWALEDLRDLFTKKHFFTIIVRFHEQSRDGYIKREIRRKVEASTMNEACNKAISKYADKRDVRVGGISLPPEVRLGSKRPPNPFRFNHKQKSKPPVNPFLNPIL